jgi:hypothetical protein
MIVTTQINTPCELVRVRLPLPQAALTSSRSFLRNGSGSMESSEPVLKDCIASLRDCSATVLLTLHRFQSGGQACGRQGIVRGLAIMVVVVR